MDFIGGIDLTKSLIFFDGMLVNSHVLSIFRITGGVALRIVYGDQGYFLFSVGGFHPSFHPNGMPVPSVPRVGVSTSFGPAWLKMDYYLAITSNTFQTGARTEAGIEVGPLNAHGWFGFDALIQFKPFQFEAVIDAGFDVEVEDVSLCNVRIEGMLSGPGPLVLRARGRVKVLFVPISGNVTIRLSDNPPALPAPIPKLVEYLSGELSNPENLRGEGDDPHFIFAPLTTVPAGTGKLIAPVGSLVWEQKRAPLNLAIEKLEGVDLGGRHTLHVSAASAFAQSDEMDWFSVGTYLKLNDGEALNNARFAQQVSGLRVGAGALDEGQAKDVTPELELYKIAAPLPVSLSPTKMAHPNYLSDGLAALLRERAGGAVPESGPARVKVLQEQWGVHSVSGDAASTGALNTVQAFAEARRRAGVAVPATDQPLSLAGVN